jgi:hypothetical protein
MGFFRQEYWSRLLFPSPGELPDPRIELPAPGLQAVSCIAGGFFANLVTRETFRNWYKSLVSLQSSNCHSLLLMNKLAQFSSVQ